ncbi:hypothetical protein P280DRAFT_282928 [Massarina eburnea CBS 473.64]|uniref:Uncharacterized protein n=1 Tax=Massarina eburnea CBS 473.64 TaxID=1395130 RepID=A0A6A6S314_9PLEO|nr:hypothetical protein P280DRAFT_282928 [Massarina eburnea CBS 473.64]
MDSTNPHRQIFPQLPPELRNLIYFYTIREDNVATNIGLPFEHKVYDSSHTTVTIMPVYRGTPHLFALAKYGFLEAQEYRLYLLSSALEFRISVIFKGNTQHFIQEHWDKKMLTHLKNLGKKYSWMKKVTRYDVQILWTPAPMPRVDTKRRVDVGKIAGRMVDVLTGGSNSEFMKKRGDVKAVLHLKDAVAVHYVFSGREMGLRQFVETTPDASHRQSRAVSIAPKKSEDAPPLPPQFKHVSQVKANAQQLLIADKGVVEWTDWTEGDLVFRKEQEMGKADAIRSGTQEERSKDRRLSMPVYLALVEECKPKTD